MASGKRPLLIGGSIVSLAAAAFVIRDGGTLGNQVSVLRERMCVGGSLNAAGGLDKGCFISGNCMMIAVSFEGTLDLAKYRDGV